VLATGSIGAIVAACHNDVPGPLLPVPPHEAPPMGPSPGPIIPTPGISVDDDAGIPIPMPIKEPTSTQVILRSSNEVMVDADHPIDMGIDTPNEVVPSHPVDASIDTLADLPSEIPDADITIVRDAAQPL